MWDTHNKEAVWPSIVRGVDTPTLSEPKISQSKKPHPPKVLLFNADNVCIFNDLQSNPAKPSNQPIQEK